MRGGWFLGDIVAIGEVAANAGRDPELSDLMLPVDLRSFIVSVDAVTAV